MEVTDQEVILNEGIVIRWDAIKNIRMAQDRLALVVKGGLTVEIGGFSAQSIDAIFSAYYRYLNLHPIHA